MADEYLCPLLAVEIDETICYDIQMVRGPGNLINKSILDNYDDLFDSGLVTDMRAARYCTGCPFNQLPGVPTGVPLKIPAQAAAPAL